MRKPRTKNGSLSDDRKAMLAMMRDARASVYRDSESFNEAAAVLEHVGQMHRGVVLSGLNDYKDAICNLGRQAPAVNSERVEFLFDTVRRARNDSVHSGDFIRHHSIRLVELLLMLEEGLAMSGKSAGGLMVQNPTAAELWQNVASVPRAMLTNSFSFLPIHDRDGVWQLLSDVAIVRYLRRAETKKDRSEMLGKQLRKAVDNDEITLTKCSCFSPGKNIDEIAKEMEHLPVLIVEKDGNKERLLGILTAFDILQRQKRTPRLLLQSRRSEGIMTEKLTPTTTAQHQPLSSPLSRDNGRERQEGPGNWPGNGQSPGRSDGQRLHTALTLGRSSSRSP